MFIVNLVLRKRTCVRVQDKKKCIDINEKKPASKLSRGRVRKNIFSITTG